MCVPSIAPITLGMWHIFWNAPAFWMHSSSFGNEINTLVSFTIALTTIWKYLYTVLLCTQNTSPITRYSAQVASLYTQIATCFSRGTGTVKNMLCPGRSNSHSSKNELFDILKFSKNKFFIFRLLHKWQKFIASWPAPESSHSRCPQAESRGCRRVHLHQHPVTPSHQKPPHF